MSASPIGDAETSSGEVEEVGWDSGLVPDAELVLASPKGDAKTSSEGKRRGISFWNTTGKFYNKIETLARLTYLIGSCSGPRCSGRGSCRSTGL